MTISGQRVRDPPADQSSTEHEDAGHVPQMRSCHFILMLDQTRRFGAGKGSRFRGIEIHRSGYRAMNTLSRRGFIFLAGLLAMASPAQAFFFTETSNESFLAIMAMISGALAFPVCVMLLALSLSEKSRPLLKKCAWFPGGMAVLTFVLFLQAEMLAELLFLPMAHAGLAVIMNRLGGT
jgi:hypothetical protein